MKDKNLSNDAKGENGDVNGMNLKGNIALVGFEVLDPAEMTVVKKIVGNYIKKMSTIGDYKEMKLTLHQHQHGKTFKHEVIALAMFGDMRFNASVTEWNLYTALSQVCEKVMTEAEHKFKKEQRHEKIV